MKVTPTIRAIRAENKRLMLARLEAIRAGGYVCQKPLRLVKPKPRKPPAGIMLV